MTPVVFHLPVWFDLGATFAFALTIVFNWRTEAVSAVNILPGRGHG